MSEKRNKKGNISIVICTINRPGDLSKCLNSITEQINPPHEVIVVDASHDNSSEEICLDWKALNSTKLKYEKANPGLTKQRNIGLSCANGDIIGFIDDDVVLDKKYLNELALVFEGDSRIFGATGNNIKIKKRNFFRRIYFKIFMLNNISLYGTFKKSGFPNFVNNHVTNRNQFTRILSGCNMFYKREIFKEFLFDEYFEGYSLMEDAEFSYRVSQKYQLMYISNAKLVHNHSPSQRIELKRYFKMTVLNHYYVFKKLVKKSDLDWLFYWWSNVGVMFISIGWAIKAKSLQPLIGFFSGLFNAKTVRL